MFIRKKKNRSGTTSVVVIDKSGGRFRELKTIGVSSDEQEIVAFYQQGKQWIDLHCCNRDMFCEAEQQREEKRLLVNWQPWSVLKISGGPYRAMAVVTISLHHPASIVLDISQCTTKRL